MRATLRTTNGTTIELDGTEAEIAQVINLATGGVPAGSRRGPGRPPGSSQRPSVASSARKPPSAARIRAMKIQGAYMGVVRSLPAQQKAQVKKVPEEKGVAAGLALAKKLASTKKN